MKLQNEEIRLTWQSDKRKERQNLTLLFGGTILVFLFCMCFKFDAFRYESKFVPVDNFKSLLLPHLSDKGSIEYLGAVARLRVTLVSFISGGALALGGAIFQTAYRNPMASPNILGATSGVSLGNVLAVSMFSLSALQHIELRYILCYGITFICLIVVFLLGKLAGGKKSKNSSVLEMVMIGSIISQGLGTFTMYLMYNLEEEERLVYQQLTLGINMQSSFVSMALFFSVMAISIIPVVIMRYRLNSLGFESEEAQSLGLYTSATRTVAQFCGVLMVTASMIHCGQIGMISLVIPYAVRNIVGADFKKVCVFSFCLGGILMMLCRLVSTLIGVLGEAISVIPIVNIVLMPAFAIVLAKRNREVI